MMSRGPRKGTSQHGVSEDKEAHTTWVTKGLPSPAPTLFSHGSHVSLSFLLSPLFSFSRYLSFSHVSPPLFCLLFSPSYVSSDVSLTVRMSPSPFFCLLFSPSYVSFSSFLLSPLFSFVCLLLRRYSLTVRMSPSPPFFCLLFSPSYVSFSSFLLSPLFSFVCLPLLLSSVSSFLLHMSPSPPFFCLLFSPSYVSFSFFLLSPLFSFICLLLLLSSVSSFLLHMSSLLSSVSSFLLSLFWISNNLKPNFFYFLHNLLFVSKTTYATSEQFATAMHRTSTFLKYKSLATFIELQSTCSQDRRPVFKPPITDGDGYLISSCFLVIALLYHAAHTLSLRPTPITRGRYSLLSLGRVTPLRTLKGITPLSRQTQRRRA
ncbi:hypothetical protein C7M84_018203 [Penaeus vannamei]|uniref:Transmembrane protein n=1 Tax=Penaeus vannamei TaxID=6689 RepID=A0A423SI31_PENVA|nr:hypothetical protein C7M84_018203 [Penaeus vannamei]